MTEVLLEARLTAAFATNGCKCCLRCNVGHVEVELTNQLLYTSVDTIPTK